MQRTSRARLAGEFSPWFVLIGYQLFVILAVSGYLMGINQSKEYAEAEWYADLWLVVVWVTYFVLYIRTLARRNEPHIYVANWYYMAFILIVAVLHIFNNIAVPVSWSGSRSYIVWSGVQDAMMQWWYGHNAVAFFLTAGFLGMLYYYLPKRAERPIYSYRLSILSFWGIVFFYVWAGSHHLHYTALPHWVQTLGMTFSVMLLVPSWATAANALLTLNGAWHKVRDDATLRFMMVAAIFYGLTTFEGSFLAIRGGERAVALHRLDRGARPCGRAGLERDPDLRRDLRAVPVIWRRERMWSNRLVEWHFWLAIGGTVIYVFAMWNSGILQGLMWRTYTEAGTLQVLVHRDGGRDEPLLHRPAVGGTMFFAGTLVGIYNIWMTIRQAPDEALALDHPTTPEGEAEREQRAGGVGGCSRRSSPLSAAVSRHLPHATTGSSGIRSASPSASSSPAASAAPSRSRRSSPSTRPSRMRPTCASTRRSSRSGATSTCARAATPATAR